MKQSQKIVKRGDYYELETAEDAFFTSKTSRKQEGAPLHSINSEHILSQLPSFKDARSHYQLPIKQTYSTAEPDELIHQLENMLHQQLRDEQKQQALRLIREARALKGDQLVGLTERKVVEEKARVDSSRTISLRSRVQLFELEQKIHELQGFGYPQLSKLQHQLEVMLGEKKVGITGGQSREQRSKEEIQNLFAHINGLSCVHNLGGLVEKLHLNNDKYVEMTEWGIALEEITALHGDFLVELKEDEVLLNSLEKGFKANVATVRSVIASLKSKP